MGVGQFPGPGNQGRARSLGSKHRTLPPRTIPSAGRASGEDVVLKCLVYTLKIKVTPGSL